MHKKIYTGTIVLALAFCFFVAFHQTEAAAPIPVTLSGYAWSDTIGWISFKGASPAYGVSVDPATGNLSGTAWSDNNGWLSFDQTQASACGAQAKINMNTGAVTGFARFINGNPVIGGYDGCVGLSGASPAYGVTYNFISQKFSGYAWGDTNVGWVSFSGTGPDYGVITDGPIIPTPVVTITANPTTGTAGITNPQLTWSATNNPTSCTASGDWTGSKPTTGNNVAQGVLTQQKVYTYTLTCTNAGGVGAPSSATVTTGTSCPLPNSETRQVACDPQYTSGSVTQSRVKDPSNSCNWGSWIYQSDTCGNAAGGFDFSTLPNSGTTNVIQGDSAQTAIQLSLTKGSTVPVTITFSGPSGLTISASSCSPTCTSTVTMTADPSAPPVTDYVVNYTATGGGVTHTGTFKVSIIASQAINVSCIPSSTSVKVGQLMTWGSTVSRGTPPYTYNWTGAVPSDARAQTASFSYAYSTTGKKTVSLTVTDSSGTPLTGTCAATSVQVGLNPIFQEF